MQHGYLFIMYRLHRSKLSSSKLQLFETISKMYRNAHDTKHGRLRPWYQCIVSRITSIALNLNMKYWYCYTIVGLSVTAILLSSLVQKKLQKLAWYVLTARRSSTVQRIYWRYKINVQREVSIEYALIKQKWNK